MRHSGPEWCSYTVIYVRMRNIKTPVNTEVFQLPANLLNCCPEKHSQKLTSLSFASERHVEPKNPMGNSLTKIKIIHLGDMLCYANQNACNSFHHSPPPGRKLNTTRSNDLASIAVILSQGIFINPFALTFRVSLSGTLCEMHR